MSENTRDGIAMLWRKKPIDVPHTDTARIQEVHVMVVHVLCQIVEEAIDR